MQVLFLLYHYFKASEIYNAIRIFIAAYVWMTGFGNFSYYHVRKDFSGREIFANDVAFELLRFVRVHCAEKRLRFILHLPYAHAVYALRVLFAVDF